MVISHFRVIEHFFRFGYFGSQQWLRQRFIIADSLQNIRNFRVNIVAQIGGIHTWIGGYLFLIETLNGFQRIVGREAKLFVAFHLQRCQVEKPWCRFCSFFNGNIRYHKVGTLHRFQKLRSFFHTRKTPLGCRESGITINGF